MQDESWAGTDPGSNAGRCRNTGRRHSLSLLSALSLYLGLFPFCTSAANNALQQPCLQPCPNTHAHRSIRIPVSIFSLQVVLLGIRRWSVSMNTPRRSTSPSTNPCSPFCASNGMIIQVSASFVLTTLSLPEIVRIDVGNARSPHAW